MNAGNRFLSALLLVTAATLSLSGETITVSESVRRIQARFIAPCCWHETLAVHQSDVAIQMRAEVATLVSRGETEEQIVDRFVARYGERILAEPRGSRLWILTITPVALLATAGLLLIFRLRRWSRRTRVRPLFGDLPSLPDFDPE
jgi:cytochrome c-type biogenesis protein CcmH